jgi:hypothetical protein
LGGPPAFEECFAQKQSKYFASHFAINSKILQIAVEQMIPDRQCHDVNKETKPRGKKAKETRNSAI